MGSSLCGGGDGTSGADPQLNAISDRLKGGQLTTQDIQDLDEITQYIQRAANQLRASIIE